MLNRIILIGRLTADPDLRYLPTGTAICSFTLAVDRARKNPHTDEYDTDFINIRVWQKLGELCAQHLKKGRIAAADGRLQINVYENKEGQRVRNPEVIAETVRFLDRGQSQSQPTNNNSANTQQQHSQTQTSDFNDPFSGGRPIALPDSDDLPF